MPAQPLSVNLLDQPEFESSSVARLFHWAVTYGRYIMIGTEVVVLLAFISRFSLDRKLTDLRQEIDQKRVVLQFSQDLEGTFRATQDTIQTVKTLLDTQKDPLDIFNNITGILPQDVRITEYYQDTDSAEIKLRSLSAEGFSLFLTRIQAINALKDIEVSEIRKDSFQQITFTINAGI